jgi:hypothetical protein
VVNDLLLARTARADKSYVRNERVPGLQTADPIGEVGAKEPRYVHDGVGDLWLRVVVVEVCAVSSDEFLLAPKLRVELLGCVRESAPIGVHDHRRSGDGCSLAYGIERQNSLDPSGPPRSGIRAHCR